MKKFLALLIASATCAFAQTILPGTTFIMSSIAPDGGGTVTSVGMTVAGPLSVTPASITSSGTFAFTWAGMTTNGILQATSATAVQTTLTPSGLTSVTATTFIGALTGHASLDLPLTGGTLTGNLLFTDNTYDIGATGATRPRTGYFGTSVISPILDSGAATDTLIKRNGTTGITLGASSLTTFSGNLKVQASDATIDLYDGATRYGTFGLSAGSLIVGATTTNHIRFFTGGAERARVTGAGNFLVGGTTDGFGFIQVIPVNFSTSSWTTNGVLTRVATVTITDSSTAGSGTAATAVANSYAIPTFAATNSTVTTTNAATVYIAGAPAAGTNMTLTNSYAQWIAAGSVRWGGYGSGAATFDANGVITSVSDARKKDVTGKFDRGLGSVLKLQPKTFHWRKDSGLSPTELNAGFIAQDVLPIIPEAIGQDRDGFYTFADRPITAALVNSTQQLTVWNVVNSVIALAALALGIRANLKK